MKTILVNAETRLSYAWNATPTKHFCTVCAAPCSHHELLDPPEGACFGPSRTVLDYVVRIHRGRDEYYTEALFVDDYSVVGHIAGGVPLPTSPLDLLRIVVNCPETETVELILADSPANLVRYSYQRGQPDG